MSLELMESLQIQLHSLSDTLSFGHHLGKTALAGDIICLDGDLGAGKTTLTQAIAKGVGVPSDIYVTSPSFNIFHEYPGRIPLYHMDFYRLGDESDIVDIGLDEYFFMSGLTVVEWSNKATNIFPEKRLAVVLQVEDDFSRKAICTYDKEMWHERIVTIENILYSSRT